jgi:uncharacterized membrane protein YbhN (UPF0104 family)
LHGNVVVVTLCSVGVLALDALTIASIVRSFGLSLSPAENLILLCLASLSTLVPTAPGYIGTYQLMFEHVFRMFGYPETVGVIAATAIQTFCFGAVTALGGIVLLSRSSLVVWHSRKRLAPEG